ncbi:ANTAR domain-containing protein [Methylotetracoccus oryzae]|uniref:ANTAR domain-containing protein n=1 Tax=Methylotetracoccus oryzae TaxID=1919059 RepID=UPI0022A74DEB|nr:ANTAR domain-containing protein [Methylotetracoccus oryzae]
MRPNCSDRGAAREHAAHEEQAYALLRKTAMNRGLRIADVARTLLSLEGMDG